ncbi:TrkA C-terminal domain-containing protein [Dokdonia sp. Hel_I_53]|uniref:TrkA C-terminal domain-containing protein n=1 Tax=Dokdonia sp. Hel_I_53 TaxID=1566287 RepID=UPI00119B8459|nr:TrkA C-terminal domain-containing protein [Dokdonia sp. Hel_I_53]TVZ53351.1 TrkA family protein [Dokdonia sp. Hel_I_53]
MIAAVSLFLIITFSVLITKICTIALVHTGLSEEIAKFQSRSAYTGAGLSTKETENIMNHPVRRKIIYNLMLIGNAGIVTAMSSLILTFVLPESNASRLYGFLIIVGGMSFLWLAIRSKWVNNGLSKIITNMLKRYTDLQIHDYEAVLHLKDDFKIVEAEVDVDGWMCHRTLEELDLREEGITILGIQRKGAGYFGSPSGTFKMLPLDKVTIYGKAEGIESIYRRKKDHYAHLEHQKFVEKEEIRKANDQQKIKNLKNQ